MEVKQQHQFTQKLESHGVGTRVFSAAACVHGRLGGPDTHQGEGRGLWFASGVGGWVLLFKLFSLLLFQVVTEGGSDMYFHSTEAFRSVLMMPVEEGGDRPPFSGNVGHSRQPAEL